MRHSPQPLKRSIGRPFWIGCLVGPILFLALLVLLGAYNSFPFQFDICVAIIVFGPVGGLIAQVGHDLVAASRLGRFKTWDFLVFTAIAIALVVAGEGLFHGKDQDIRAFRNPSFNFAIAFIVATILVYAISKNLGHFLSRHTWSVILLTIALLATCIGVYRLTGFDLTWILAIGTGFWAAIDSAKIHLTDYKSGISYGPVVLFFGFVLLWVIAFPWYLIVRHDIKSGAAVLKERVGNGVGGSGFYK